MTDQLDRELVHARVSRQCAGRQLGQFLVVLVRERGANLAHVLLNDVIVVQQPLARGRDVDPVRRRVAQSVLYLRQYRSCIVQAAEQRTGATPHWRWSDLLLARDGSRAFGEPVDPEHLASDRTYEMRLGSASPVILRTSPGQEALEDVLFGFGGRSCSHVAKVKDPALAVPRICTPDRPVRSKLSRDASNYCT